MARALLDTSPMEALPGAINLCKFQSPTSRTVVTQPRVNASRPLFRFSGHSSFHDSLLRVQFSGCPRDLRSRPVSKASDHRHDHHHQHDDDDPHHHHHSHHDHDHDHHRHGGGAKLTGPQRALGEFARAIGWVDLANLLRENLQMCCCSAALFLAAAACPYLIPKPVVKPFQNSLMLLAFPLVGVRIFSGFFMFLVGLRPKCARSFIDRRWCYCSRILSISLCFPILHGLS